MDNMAKMKGDLLEMTLCSYREKLFVGTSGNLSMRLPGGKGMLITPSNYPYERMTADDLVAIDFEGGPVEGRHEPSSEWRMHAAVYKSRPDAMAVIHTHSPFATSLAVTQERIPIILIEMVPFLGGDVPLADFAVPGTPEVGQRAVEAMAGGRHVCLLANHGVLAVGESLEQAHIRAVYIEDAAQIYLYAKMNGNVNVIQNKYVDMMLGR